MSLLCGLGIPHKCVKATAVADRLLDCYKKGKSVFASAMRDHTYVNGPGLRLDQVRLNDQAF